MNRFILLAFCLLLRVVSSAQPFYRMYGPLDHARFHIKTEKKATVAFLGGSITNMEGWRHMVCDYLQAAYPDTKFTFINAGIPSLGSVPHAFRLQQDVLDKGPIDLLFIEAAVNDHQNGTPADQQRKALEGIIRHAHAANPDMDMVLMAFAEADKLKDYEVGRVPEEVALHNRLAAYYHLPFINLAKEVYERIKAGEFSWEKDFKDLHPAPFGQELYFKAIRAMLSEELKGSDKRRPGPARLPAALEPQAYTQGIYVPVSDAQLLQGFTLVPSWTPGDGVATREDFVQVPVLEANRNPASLHLSFEGTAVGIAVLSGPDAGIIRYSVDGGPEKTMDLYTQWSNGLHLPWYLVLGDGLPAGKHTLVLKLADKANLASKGNACRIVHFLVNK